MAFGRYNGHLLYIPYLGTIYLTVLSNLQAGAIEPCGFYVLRCWYLPVSVSPAFRRCHNACGFQVARTMP